MGMNASWYVIGNSYLTLWEGIYGHECQLVRHREQLFDLWEGGRGDFIKFFQKKKFFKTFIDKKGFLWLHVYSKCKKIHM